MATWFHLSRAITWDGMGMCPTGLGFVLQDRGEMFSSRGSYKCMHRERPFIQLSGIYYKKQEAMDQLRSYGGDMQPQGHVQIVVNLH